MALKTIKEDIDNAIKMLEAAKTKISIYSKFEIGLKDEGRNEVWEFVKRLFDYNSNTKLTSKELKKIFGLASEIDILRNFTPQEALAKIEAYEKEQKEIKVGDVVYIPTVNTEDEKEDYGVVTNIYAADKTTRYEILMHNGDCMSYYDYEIEKTNKHIDIQSILEQIGVDKDEKKI